MKLGSSISGAAAACAVLCAAVMVFIVNVGTVVGILVCWLFCVLLIRVGETAGNALSSGGRFGKNIGAGAVCALLLIPAFVELFRDLGTPKPPNDRIFDLWGIGSFILFLISGPPVLAAIILNTADVINRNRRKSENASRSARAVRHMLGLIYGLAGYAAVLLLLQLY